jgi:hypothetical protein
VLTGRLIFSGGLMRLYCRSESLPNKLLGRGGGGGSGGAAAEAMQEAQQKD